MYLKCDTLPCKMYCTSSTVDRSLFLVQKKVAKFLKFIRFNFANFRVECWARHIKYEIASTRKGNIQCRECVFHELTYLTDEQDCTANREAPDFLYHTLSFFIGEDFKKVHRLSDAKYVGL
ncbi:unnamed protein product [Rhizopus stolonifer]